MSFGVDASQNYLTWGNVQAVQLTSKAKAGDTTFDLPIAKRRAPGFKELVSSNGKYTTKDVVFLLPKKVCDTAGATGRQAPKPSDVITAEGERWTILECPLNTLRSTYRCMTRNMILAYDLRDTLTVRRPKATTETDDAAGRQYEYDTIYTGVAAAFQETECDAVDERGQRLTRKMYKVWVEERLYLTIEDQVLDDAGNVYEVKAWRSQDTIDTLQELDCELRWAKT